MVANLLAVVAINKNAGLLPGDEGVATAFELQTPLKFLALLRGQRRNDAAELVVDTNVITGHSLSPGIR